MTGNKNSILRSKMIFPFKKAASILLFLCLFLGCRVAAATDENCEPNTYIQCWSGNVYWHDSCGRRETLYDQCEWGEDCVDGECIAVNVDSSGCQSNSYKKCYGGNVYWYDSCGRRRELYEKCGAASSTGDYRCEGDWIMYEAATSKCSYAACTGSSTWVRYQNCASSGRICKNGVCIIDDAVSPVIMNFAPSGMVYRPNLTLVVNTNEAAECRFATEDIPYESMTMKFNSPNKIYHSVPATLSEYGNYVYYVRCADILGNVNQTSVKIEFAYTNGSTVTARKTVIDLVPPVISDLAPSGDVETNQIIITCATDENAFCKYDIVDTDYESMKYSMDSQNGGTIHSKILETGNKGSFVYYVRCIDAAGNGNAKSAKIYFNYVSSTAVGPKISGLKPTGTVYQKDIALSAVTDHAAECRWATEDKDFSEMAKAFLTSDGQTQYSIIELADYGEYDYYVRCKDENGDVSAVSSRIIFQYADPNAEPVSQKMDCAKKAIFDKDGVCDNTGDCACDPDCPTSGDGADPDCTVTKLTIPRDPMADTVGIAVTGVLAIIVTMILFSVLARSVAKKPTGDDGEW